MRILIALAATAGLAAGCGDNTRPAQEDGAPVDGASGDGPPPDASPAAGPCLDRPTDLPRPPAAGLPCELLPPGFGS